MIHLRKVCRFHDVGTGKHGHDTGRSAAEHFLRTFGIGSAQHGSGRGGYSSGGGRGSGTILREVFKYSMGDQAAFDGSSCLATLLILQQNL